MRWTCCRAALRTPRVPSRRKVIESIHDFQRQGGLSRQLEQFDRVLSSYLIAPPSAAEGQSEATQVGSSLHSRAAHAPASVDVHVLADEQ